VLSKVSILSIDRLPNSEVRIGARLNNSEHLNGAVDDIRIYNRDLSDSEIQELYNEGGSTTSTPTPTLAPTPTPTLGTGVLFGFVYDEDENPMTGVTVSITGDVYSDSEETDYNGYYEFRDLSAGDYTITCEKEGYQTQTVETTLDEGDKKEVETVTMILVEKGKIYGYVVNIKGNPIESVRLKLKGVGTKVIKKASTDADGFFEFTDLEADTYVIFASKKGYKKTKSKVKLEEGEDREVEIEIRKTIKRIKLEGMLD